MNETRIQTILAILTQYAEGRVDRRQAIKMLSAAGIAVTGAAALGRASVSAHQDAPATPVVGPREDGSNLWKVQVGGMDMANAIDVHGYFPTEITINAGDAIWFQFAPMGMPGFHTVTFTSGGELPGLFAPDIVDGTPVASPEGPPRIQLNPQLLFPDGVQSYDGTGLVNSGFDILRMEEGPYMLTFTTPGTYEYMCAAHSIVMKGTVTVQEAGSELPFDPAAYEAKAQEEFAAMVEQGVAAIAEVEASAASPAADGPAMWDVAAGAGGLSQARVMRFLPQEITIKAGDAVRWTNLSVGEPHTVTFLGGEEQPEDTIVEPQEGGPPKFIQNFRTFMPAGGGEFNGTGYHNSGFLGLPPEIGDMFGLLGESYELTFTAPGEYPYYCILHAGGPEAEGGMIGKVIVTE